MTVRHEAAVRIQNRLGLHARPAAEFVKLASRFRAEVRVEKDELEVNGKSIMGVMMLAAEAGASIRIQATGSDAENAVDSLTELVLSGFSEELDPDAGMDGLA
ncbi:HPr family phosphocarrier protein [Candidatus Palauibacter polyketidifaciens]|uniref:HPr family phosphocarrier protein n=1 Tax=Candidatus Palauibacter polyketidifaciens TaxID=3056740 RepID=UPI0023829ED9|nr:HPr family phosphocarrier protein [Candidatus Palauibacter polyketidifaciens]MDE2719649.1 HPr family phosphocarrier protein [Candidatus Palauibacter polyketidifaciens]